MINPPSLKKNELRDNEVELIDPSCFGKVRLNNVNVIHSLIPFIWNLKSLTVSLK